MKAKNLILVPAVALAIEACSSSQDTITNDIGSLSASKQNTKVVKDTTKVKRNFLLPPAPFYDAWSTGTTLTQWAPVVDGPINLNLERIYGEGFLEYAKLDSNFIQHFEKTNTHFKTKEARSQFGNLLSQYKLFPKELAHVFADGKLLSKEEMDLINDNVPKGESILPFYYKSTNYNDKKVSRNKKESVPGILRIVKKDHNSDYEFLMGEEKVKEEQSKQDSLVVQDTSYCERDTSNVKQNFMDIGFGYDFDNMFNLDLRFRLGKNLSLGPAFGVSLEDKKNVWIPTSKYIGDGTEIMQDYFFGVSAGIDLGKYVMLNLGLGIESQKINVDEKIRRKTQEVLSHNTDNYLRTGFRMNIEPSFNVTRDLSLGVNAAYNTIKETKLHPRDNWYAGLRARLKVR